MATIATAEVRIIADTRRFVPDLRRKLRQAFSGIGDDLGERIEKQISSRLGRRLETLMARLGRNAGNQFSQQFSQSFTNLTRTTAAAGERAGREFTRNFRLEADFEVVMREWLREGVGGTEFSAAGTRLARNFGTAFDTELNRFAFAPSVNPITIRRSQQFVDNLVNTMVTRTRNRSQDLVRAFEDGLSDLRDSDRAAGFVRDLVDRMVSEAEARGPDVGEALGNGINQALFEALAGSEIETGEFFERVGNEGALHFQDGFTDTLGSRLRREMQEAIDNAGIPPIFRRIGNVSATNFVEEFDDSLTATLGRAFQRLGGREADEAGDRAGARFARGFTNALRALPAAFASLLNVVVARPLGALGGVFSEMTSEMLSVAGQMLAVVALLEALSGLLFALPAAVGVAGAAIATMIVPLKGIIEAFDTAGGPADEFEKSLEGLTPAAQSVVREFRAISPALTDLRLRAQAALFAELGGAITEVADNLLGPLSDGLESSSGAFGRIIDQIAEFLAQSETADTVAATFDALTEVFDAVAESTEPFLEGMRTLVDEFIPEIEELADPLSDMGDEFKEWAERVTESGEAMEAFDRGKDTLQEIFDIALDITGIFDAMFDAAESVGVDALGAVADAIADIREEFESVEGQEALGEIFDALGRIADVIGDVFGTLFEEMGELAPEIAEFFEEVGPPVQELIDGLSEGIQELLDSGGTDFFKDLAQALADVDWKEIGEDIGEFLSGIGPLLKGLGTALNVVVDVLEFIVDLFDFIDDLFGQGSTSKWGDALNEFFDELLNTDEVKAWIKEFDEAVVIFFTEHFPQQIRDGLQFLVDEAREFWGELTEGFKQLVEGLSTIVIDGFVGIGEGFTTGLDTVVTTITTFVETTLLTWGNFFLGLKDSALLALQGIGLDITGFFDGTTGDFSGFQNGISEGWNAFWTGLKDFASSQMNLARDVISGILNGIKSIVSGFISNVKAGWDAFWNGLSSTVSGGMSTVRDLVSGALDTLRSAFDGFRDQVEDIWNGLVSFLQGIADTVSGIVDRISGFVSSAIDAASNLGNIDLTPFANGGIVNGPTPALVGEAGREVIIPLTRPARAVELARHSGLIDLLTAQGVLAGAGGAVSGPAAPVVGEMHVHSQNADPDQVARKALRLIERRMGGRGLERTS